MTVRLGLLASHGGTTAAAVTDACGEGSLDASVGLVVSNNSQSRVLATARQRSIAAVHLSTKTHPDPVALDDAMLKALLAHDVELLVLAGYLRALGPRCTEHFRGRAINVHPALLPKFGGHGMFGDQLYEAVLASGDRETGVTAHYVTAEYDAGAIIAQVRVPVRVGDTIETLRARVQPAEAELLIGVLASFAATDRPTELAE
jgi:phosphoribosylglycinamide formyltransferase-1